MIGLLRVRNEARWIERAVTSIWPLLCSEVVVLDDHSTDDTVAIARRLGCTVITSRAESINEALDRETLLQYAYCHPPVDGWCIMIDGDEALHEDDGDRLKWYLTVPGYVALSPRIVYLWDSTRQERVDGCYRDFRRPSIFRMLPGLHFAGIGDAALHCRNVPALLVHRAVPVPVRLLHYGYMLASDRLRKYAYYCRVDPANEVEDCYRHIVQGDIPEVPASARLKHAGPLRLEPSRL